MKKINVLIHMNTYNGGAAFSCFEYAKTLNRMGFNVFTCGEILNNKNSIKEMYNNENFKTYNIKRISTLFNNKKFIRSFFYINKLHKLIINNHINLIVTTCIEDAFFLKNYKNIKILLLIAGGKANYKSNIYKKILDFNDYICFSKENIESIINCRLNAKNIWLISNRIKGNEDKLWLNHYNNSNNIKLLIASRITNGKINSIKYIINLCYYLYSNGENIELHIVGDGNKKSEIELLAKSINKKAKKNIIVVRGYINDIISEFTTSHIVFGKGRSVIEGIMMNRIGIVVGEHERMSLCDNNSFNNLYYYNFSGRNIEHETSYQDLLYLIKKIKSNNLNYNKYKEIFEKTREKYDSLFLLDKLNNIISKNLEDYENKYNYNKIKVFISNIIIFVEYLIIKIKNKLGINNDN